MDGALRAAWIGAIATVVSGVIGLAGVLITASNGSGAAALGSTSSSTAPGSSARAQRCLPMIREVRDLPRADPALAALLARTGRAHIPGLWDVDEVKRCGGVDPETLLEGSLAP
jgi:hypothetical protein